MYKTIISRFRNSSVLLLFNCKLINHIILFVSNRKQKQYAYVDDDDDKLEFIDTKC